MVLPSLSQLVVLRFFCCPQIPHALTIDHPNGCPGTSKLKRAIFRPWSLQMWGHRRLRPKPTLEPEKIDPHQEWLDDDRPYYLGPGSKLIIIAFPLWTWICLFNAWKSDPNLCSYMVVWWWFTMVESAKNHPEQIPVNPGLGKPQYPHMKINMSPENGPFQKDIYINILFQPSFSRVMLFGGVYCTV